jgi:hypothetical protein
VKSQGKGTLIRENRSTRSDSSFDTVMTGLDLELSCDIFAQLCLENYLSPFEGSIFGLER